MLRPWIYIFTLSVLVFSSGVSFASSSTSGDDLDFSALKKLSIKNMKHLVKNPHEVIGVELIIAGPTTEYFESRWGHSALRFVNQTPDWGDDFILSFAAAIKSTFHNPLRGVGLPGSYSIFPSLIPFERYWKNYVLDQKRYIERHIISLTEESINGLIATLEHWVENKEHMGTYSIFSNNCAHVLARLFVDAGLTTTYKCSKSPLDLPDYFKKNLIANLPPLRAPNSIEEIWPSTPSILYTMCETGDCAEEYQTVSHALWSEFEIEHARIRYLEYFEKLKLEKDSLPEGLQKEIIEEKYFFFTP